MMLEKTEAFPLGKLKYGDSDLIVRCYTSKFGLRSFLVKGILNSKRGGQKSLFQPLTHCEIVAAFKPHNSLCYIKEVKLLKPYISIPFDLIKNALIFFIAETLRGILSEEPDKNVELFEFIKVSFSWLDINNAVGNFHIKFLLDITKHIGFYPNIGNPEAPFFDLKNGCTTSDKPDGLFLKDRIKSLWIRLLGTDLDGASKIILSKSERAMLLNYTMDYFHLHLQNFKKNKSVPILNEVFKTI